MTAEEVKTVLVRHPTANRTESLLGYGLRLSECNGYDSPWSLYSLAGMKQSEIGRTGMRIEKLAQIACQPAENLRKLRFGPPKERPRWCRLLGHEILPTDITLKEVRLCPECVEEEGFIEAHWHLNVMIGCSVHRLEALSICPECGDAIRWYRPGLLRCKCGAELSGAHRLPLANAEACLLEIIRRKVLGLPMSFANPASLPQDELASSSLRAIIVIIQGLGKFRAVADDSTKLLSDRELIRNAAAVLCDWPRNLHRLLRDLAARDRGTKHSSIRRRFDPFLTAVCENKTITASETEFVRKAFLEFATMEWEGAFIDSKLLSRTQSREHERFVSLSAFARRLGVQPRVAMRILEARRTPPRRVACGSRFRYVVDLKSISCDNLRPGRILSAREAARALGISVILLGVLRGKGIFQTPHQTPAAPGFDSLDVERFQRRLVERASESLSTGQRPPDMVRLRDVARSSADTTDMKVCILDAVLRGQINALRPVDGTVGGLLFHEPDVVRVISEARGLRDGATVTLGQAARRLQCDKGAIQGLVAAGFLRLLNTLAGPGICSTSLALFNSHYVSLAILARDFASSSRALAPRCKELGISIVGAHVGNHRGPQPFVPRTDVAKLLPFTRSAIGCGESVSTGVSVPGLSCKGTDAESRVEPK